MLRTRSEHSVSTGSSPIRKRPRVTPDSSSQDELPLPIAKPSFVPPSQRTQRPLQPQLSQKNSAEAKARRDRAIQNALREAERERNKARGMQMPSAATSSRPLELQPPNTQNIDNGGETIPSSQDSQMEKEGQGGHSSSDHTNIQGNRDPSPPLHQTSGIDDETSPDFSEWFAPSNHSAPVAFAPASQLPTVADKLPRRASVAWKPPSEELIVQLSQKITQWQEEVDDESDAGSLPKGMMQQSDRPALATIDGNITRPARPSISPLTVVKPVFRTPLRGPPPPSTPKSASLASLAMRNRVQGLNASIGDGNMGFTQPLSPLLLSNDARTAPLSQVGTPPRNPSQRSTAPGLGMTPRARLNSASRPTFNTPFKQGMAPGEHGRILAEKHKEELRTKEAAEALNKVNERRKQELKSGVFDLALPSVRHSMEWFGVMPGSFTSADLVNLGIPAEIPSITLSNAVYYRFNAPSSSQVTCPTPDQFLGVNAALLFLRSKGCSLVKNEWVENHWSMVLWKLAKLICACPTLFEDKWRYEEVVNQLMYRYERETNQAQRPAVRLIQERDCSSSRPLVLCVYGIQWSEPTLDEHGEKTIPPHPELELTDGWYKIRGALDGALARAVQKGKLKVGTKLAISGAKLEGTKEGCEPLQAFHRSHLVLSGNSTTLARWQTKLGFQQKPFIATLRSLSADGGAAMLLDIEVIKLFPLGFIEMPSNGGRASAPRCEAEEREVDEQWKIRLANEETRLQNEFEKKISALEAFAARCERLAKGFLPPVDAHPPDIVEDILDDLEDIRNLDPTQASDLLKKLSPDESGWLARRIMERCQELRLNATDEIARELNDTCPPRKVRNFRVVLIKDYQTQKHPSRRLAKITVWDVLDLGDDFLSEGRRFLVSNLAPSQPGSWQHHDTQGAEVYLVSRKNSRWTRLPTSK